MIGKNSIQRDSHHTPTLSCVNLSATELLPTSTDIYGEINHSANFDDFFFSFSK